MTRDDHTARTASDLIEALHPLDARSRAMFGGYCFYVSEKVAGLVCDGSVFVKRSSADHLLADWATLAPAYPGAKPSWRLPADALRDQPDRVREIIAQVADALPARRKT